MVKHYIEKSRALHLGIYPQNYRKKNKVLEHTHVWSSHQKPLKSFGQTLTLDGFTMATLAILGQNPYMFES